MDVIISSIWDAILKQSCFKIGPMWDKNPLNRYHLKDKADYAKISKVNYSQEVVWFREGIV